MRPTDFVEAQGAPTGTDASPADPAKPPRSRRSTLLAIGISVVSLAACLWWAAQQSAPRFPTSLEGATLVGAAVLTYGISIALRGARWAIILRRAGIRSAAAEPYKLTVIGYMGNTVLPLRGGEVIRIALLTERSNASWQEALGSIIPERVLDTAALAVLLVLVTVAGTGGAPAGYWPAAIAAGATVVLGLIGITLLRLRESGYLDSLADRIRPFTRASRQLFTPVGAGMLALSIGIWSVEAVAFWLCAQSLDLSVSLLGALLVDVLASFFALIPAGPAYAGTYDAAILFAAHSLGVQGGDAVSFMLLIRFVVFIPVTLVGLLLVIPSRLLLRRVGLSAPTQK